MNKYYLKIWLIAVLASGMWGCKTIQKTGETAIHGSIKTLTEKISRAQPEFSSANIKKMNIGINLNGNKYNSAASCRIIADSLIYISVQPFFGMEMFAARFSKDEILVLDKIKKVYYRSGYTAINNMLGFRLDLSVVEALLTDKFFIVKEHEASVPKMKQVKGDSNEVFLLIENKNIHQKVSLNPDFTIRKMSFGTPSGETEKFTAEYADFKTLDGMKFPYSYRIQSENQGISLNCNISISKLSFNESLAIPEINLDNYRQGNIDSLLK